MKNLSVLIIFSVSFLSCSKKVIVNNANDQTCYFSFPKEAKVIKVLGDDPSLDWLIKFSKDKNIFISTNDISGSPLNSYKQDEFGDDVFLKIVASDSLVLKGKNRNGNWKEIKKDGLVYGYLNIPDFEVNYFEKLIIPICKQR